MCETVRERAYMAQKTVVLGVSACIGAYKACYIVRGLQKAGIRVRVVMTEHATELVGPKTFEALTHEPVLVGMFDETTEDPIPHITLANEADLMIVAPCTANTMAKLANGIADDLLTSAALAMHCPMLIAPAANVHMYEDATTQANLATLRDRGWTIVEGGEGYLACGDEGYGRLAEPDAIVAAALELLDITPDMQDIHVLITAGPTREAIDPVRFITNYSSGKTGYALAEAARDRGAKVTLVAGPTALDDPTGIDVVHINSAQEMFDACNEVFPSADIAIFSAAVSDARPKETADHKLKKGIDDAALRTIELVENPDILATLAAQAEKQAVIGYAAETDKVLENARIKRAKKHADCIVANEVSPTKGFGTDENQVWLVTEEGESEVPTADKDKIAHVVLDKALAILLEKRS
ncbi:MAG: bifunctional phosphopantothenoylcysteine decarboxylase/phosphopantothenate--cysteine ligase CoaBC [Eggerthellaceae bacterium]|nr:bifunctional phosphopantothenoylcysteine decarboxylase/phosphopantothenate--cysteine ligase CoaBC [Eggerthellaceae bacterium]